MGMDEINRDAYERESAKRGWTTGTSASKQGYEERVREENARKVAAESWSQPVYKPPVTPPPAAQQNTGQAVIGPIVPGGGFSPQKVDEDTWIWKIADAFDEFVDALKKIFWGIVGIVIAFVAGSFLYDFIGVERLARIGAWLVSIAVAGLALCAGFWSLRWFLNTKVGRFMAWTGLLVLITGVIIAVATFIWIKMSK